MASAVEAEAAPHPSSTRRVRCLRCGASVAWTSPTECAEHVHAHQVRCGGAQTFLFE